MFSPLKLCTQLQQRGHRRRPRRPLRRHHVQDVQVRFFALSMSATQAPVGRLAITNSDGSAGIAFDDAFTSSHPGGSILGTTIRPYTISAWLSKGNVNGGHCGITRAAWTSYVRPHITHSWGGRDLCSVTHVTLRRVLLESAIDICTYLGGRRF